tara:strand:- start:10559 stop:13747 length:3189 start_codon:yes stop_codon:yes gene_type:complete
MASFGKVLDLLDERYLNLQDVIGNVEPLPTLVPYEQYKQNVLVYRMDTDHELFMGLIQDFTGRMSYELGKELWTWCVQWDVQDKSSGLLNDSAPSPKKARLQSEAVAADSSDDQAQRKQPIIDIFNRCELDPRLTKEEDMLRILIDIVQVDSTIVPNFIEFLYRWVDYYEGDGKALKAALKWEIPSLWEFDYHPLVLPEDVKKKVEEEKVRSDNENSTTENGQSVKGVGTRGAQELVQSSPTKMREKPDLSAFERQVEESERLQYREVKYGIQPPKLQQTLSPLINIPRDPARRVKYYAACFKSRQRAVVLLLEAGVSMQQIGNYRKRQSEHPRDTSGKGDPKDLVGLRHYHKDAAAAQEYFAMKEKMQLQREKHKEIAISSKLAIEAQLAAANSALDGPSGVPLIPPTPSYPRPPDMAAEMLGRIRAARARGEERVNFVPTPLVGRMRSKLFEGAKDRRSMQGPGRPGTHQPLSQAQSARVIDDSDEDGSDSEGSSDEDGDAFDPGTTIPPMNPAPDSRDLASLGQTSQRPPHAPQPNASNNAGPNTIGAASTQAGFNSSMIAEFIRNLPAEHADRLLPILHQRLREALAEQNALQGSSHQVPLGNNASTGASPSNLPPMIAADAQHMASNGTHQQTTSASGASMIPGSGLSRSASTSSLPPPILPRSITITPQPHLPTLPFMPPPARTSNPQVAPALGPSTPSQRPMGFQLQGPSHSAHPLNSSHQGMHQMPTGMGRPPGPPQISRLPMTTPLTMPQLPPLLSPYFSHQNTSLQRPTPSQLSEEEENLRDLPRQLSMPAAFRSLPQPSLPRPPPPPITISAPYPPSQPTTSTPRTINRLAPQPLTLTTNPLTTSSPDKVPIQIYFPRVVIPGNGIGPLGQKLGDNHAIETDAFLLGHSRPGSGRIELSKALFMPVGCWTNTLRRVRKGAYQVLETYPAPGDTMPLGTSGAPHGTVYALLAAAYGFMRTERGEREEMVTKRWRVSPGPMTVRERGAVWEGWGVTVDRALEMGVLERQGALVRSWVVDGKKGGDEEAERRRRELEELMEEEGWDDEEEEMDE